MRDFHIDKVGRLRKLEQDDLERILEWRNVPKVRENMYSQHEISMTEHLNWWEKVKNSEADRYFIFEHNSEPMGLVSFNAIDVFNKNAFWAFYSSPQAPKGTGSRMELLVLEYCFTELGLHKLCCEVLEFNRPVVALHKKFGFVEEGFFKEQRLIGSRFVGVFRLAIDSKSWAALRTGFLPKIDPEAKE